MKRVVIFALAISGCTDARIAEITSLGSPGEITCYSGGKVIYEGKSTGKIASEEKSDGWLFKEESSGKLIRVSADCVIKN
jgi:hypothetical protein